MFCSKCGARLENGTCPVCGYHSEIPMPAQREAADVGQTTVLSGVDPYPVSRDMPPVEEPSLESTAPEPQYAPPAHSAPEPQYVPPAYSAPEPQYAPPAYSAPQPQYAPLAYTAPQPSRTPAFAAAPALQLPTKRGLGKMFWLGLITLGIYPTVIYSRLSGEINMIASRYDGKRTMHYLGTMLLAEITLGIVPLVWNHRLAARIGTELTRRGIGYTFSAKYFWLWNILGSLILVGPFIYIHKLMKAMNLLCENYNRLG